MAKEILWTPAEKKVLGLIESNLENFLRACASQALVSQISILCSTVGWQDLVKRELFKTNPNLGCKLLAVGRGFHFSMHGEAHRIVYGVNYPVAMPGWPNDQQLDFFKKLKKTHWKTILKYARKGMGFEPHHPIAQNSNTDDVKELLGRGFQHWWDMDDLEDDVYVVVHEPSNLCYPREQYSLEKAEEILSNFGTDNCYIFISKDQKLVKCLK